MKNFMIAVALVGCAVACNSEKKSVSSADSANMPKTELSTGACTDKVQSECPTQSQKASCCPEKAKPQG